MRSSKKQAKQITSAIMAIVMTATTTFQMPVIAMADETMSTAAVESQIEEVTEESSDVSVQNETDAQTSVEATVADTSEALESDSTEVTQTPAAVVESTAEVTCEEEETSLPAEVDPSGEDTEESKANETRGPDDETAETTQIETEVEAESEAESTSEIETEGSTEAEKADPFAALDPSAGFTEEDLAAIDFSSRRLLIAADPAVIIDPEHVLSSYAGVYLMQYETESQAKYAYAYYYGKSEFVDVDTVISVADGDNSANAAAPMAADENPIAELHEAVAENPVKAAGAVAVIDTGVNGVANVTESVSMIGDNTADENGHGTKMAQLIAEQNPDVSILSIKALGADGTGDVSAVYAAIQYAIDKKVSVINLSMSAMGTAENAALTSVIDSAVKAGIAVVGAAGNKGMDVRFFVPGNVESAYIIGAADENGARIATSNYGSTVDFNVVADSTSEAAAKFSGYYTLNGAVADEKLVFPTDYVKEEKIDYNGPIIKHQISFYNYQGSQDDLVWVGQKKMRTVLDDEYITTYIGFAEDSEVVSRLDVFVDFMSIASERVITDECIVDLENMTVKIPASYKDADLTVRWFMPNASYQYCYDTDSRYMISNTPEKFKVAATFDVSANLSPEVAKSYVAGEYDTGYTHAPESMNHSYITGSTTQFKENEYFTIQAGYIASVEDTIDHGEYYYNGHDEVKSIFGSDALKLYARNPKTKKLYVIDQPTAETFLCHFSTVTRDADNNSDVSSWFNNIGGKGNGVIKVDVDNSGTIDHSENSPEKIDAGIGWLFGTCGNNTIGGSCPSFEAGGKIICTSIGADGTAYFFYYCRSKRAQWAAGSFSITPVLPKTGYLRIHKSSSNPALTDGNSCYSFTNITYKIYSDSACTTEAATFTLNKDGYSDPVELTEGTYYIKETDAVNSGYALDPDAHEVTVTAGTTFDAPQTWDTKDAPLNDPFGIVINKISADGNATADLSNAYYTIKYYPKQYNSVEEIQAETDPSITPTVWVIRTKKSASGYFASLDADHYVEGISAGAVYGQNSMGTFVIPLGTITVQETQAPAGFTVKGATVKNAKTGSAINGSNDIYLFQLVDEKSGIYLKVGNALDTDVNNETAMTLTYAEQKDAGGISVQKYDSATADGMPVAGTGATLAGIKYSITNVSGYSIVNSAGYTIPHGAVAEVITTNANGYASTGAYDLPKGTYIVEERRSDSTFDGQTFVDGTSDYANYFYLWDGHKSGKILISDGSVGTITSAGTFYDTLAYGGLYLYKYDSATGGAPVYGSGATLAGVQFAIINNNNWEIVNCDTGVNIPKGGVAAVITTDANGYAATGNRALPAGDYIVKELRAGSTVNGTTLVEGTSDFANYFYYWKDQQLEVTIEKNKAGVLTYAGTLYDDLAYGGLYVLKRDSVTRSTPVSGSGASLAGIRFAVINNNNWEVENTQTGINTPKGGVVMIIETNEDGYAATKNYALPVGDYIVRELRMDASFDGTTLTEGTSGYANYYYHWQDNRTNVSISKNDLGTLVWKQNQTFYNDLAYGGIKLQKQDSATNGAPVAGSGASLEGIKFAIVNNNDWAVENAQTGINVPKGGVVMFIETDKNGYAATGNYSLPVGSYIVRELCKDASFDGKNFVEGNSDYANYFYYWKDLRKEVTIAKNQVGTLVDAGNFRDDLAYGGLYLYKYDSATNGAPVSGSGATLAGVRFAVINNNSWDVLNTDTGVNVPKGGVVTVITTDANGYAATGNYSLPVGDYIVKELRADSTVDGTTLTEGTSEFANYFYYWKDEQQKVTITKNQIGVLTNIGTFYNDLAYGGLYVLKRDSVTRSTPVSGSGASLAGIRFAVINNNNWEVANFDTNVNTPKGGVVMVIETNEDGYAATKNYALPVGDYIVKELRVDATVDGTTLKEGTSDFANYFYYWQNNSTNVSISKNDLGTLVWNENQTFYDDIAYGGIKLQKQDSATDGAPVSGSGASLEGIKFAIINNNDWDVENTQTGINVPKGGVVTVITTDETGCAATGEYALPVGKYIVKELRFSAVVNGTTVVDGSSDYANYFYYWKDQQKEVTIAKNQMGTLVDAGNFKDDLAYGGIKLQKYDSTTNGAPAEGSNVSLAGIKFAVVNNNDWNVVNHETGIVTPKGGVVMVIETDEDGVAATKEYALPVGNYIVRELRMDASFDGMTLTEGTSEYANNDYWWKDQEKSVAIEKNSIGTLVSAGTFYNVPVGGGIKLQKYDKTSGGAATGGRTLSGISFAVINNNNWSVKNYAGNLIGKGGVVQVITTDENGYAATGTHDLPLGNYIVRELRMDASFDGQQFSEGKSDYANDDYWWKEQSVTVSVTEQTAGTLIWTDPFYDSPVVTPVPTGIIITVWPYMAGMGGCILVFILLFIWRHRKKRR